MNEQDQHMVVVVTTGNAIYCGYTSDHEDSPIIHLTDARQAVYYSADTQGLLGLAAHGPAKGSRIGPKVARTAIRNVTQIIECSPEARRAWENATWEA